MDDVAVVPKALVRILILLFIQLNYFRIVQHKFTFRLVNRRPGRATRDQTNKKLGSSVLIPPTVGAQNLTLPHTEENSSLSGQNPLARELKHYAA